MDNSEDAITRAIHTRSFRMRTALGRTNVLVSKDEYGEWIWLVRYLDMDLPNDDHYLLHRVCENGIVTTKEEIKAIATERAIALQAARIR